jgi:hypothetical protein
MGFRAAYRKSMRGGPSHPASKKQAREMIAFLTLERAVHEVTTNSRAGQLGWRSR